MWRCCAFVLYLVSLWLITYLSLTKIGVLQCAPRCIWLWIWFLHMTLWRKMCFKSFIKGHIVSMMSALSVGHVSTSQRSGVVYGIHRWSTMTQNFPTIQYSCYGTILKSPVLVITIHHLHRSQTDSQIISSCSTVQVLRASKD